MFSHVYPSDQNSKLNNPAYLKPGNSLTAAGHAYGAGYSTAMKYLSGVLTCRTLSRTGKQEAEAQEAALQGKSESLGG